jgi:Ca-activated chloride channel homolog
MRFGEYQILTYLIWIVPALAVFFFWSARKESLVMRRFADKELIPEIAPRYRPGLNKARMLLNVLAVFFLVLAAARPQWGFFWKEEKSKGLDIVFALDTSKSMLARDMSPDRLSFAKMEIKEFVKRLEGDRFGLIAFSGEAFLQCPITVDYGGFFIALDALNEETIPQGGTVIASAVDEAIKSYEGAMADNKVLILITDGENTEGNVKEAAKKAKDAGIMVSTIGIGSSAGEKIPIIDAAGSVKYLKDKEGRVVTSKLQEDTLKMLAEATGGVYVRASQSEFGLGTIYSERLGGLERKETEDRKIKVYKERYQYPVGIAFLLLLTELILRGKGARKKVS